MPPKKKGATGVGKKNVLSPSVKRRNRGVVGKKDKTTRLREKWPCSRREEVHAADEEIVGPGVQVGEEGKTDAQKEGRKSLLGAGAGRLCPHGAGRKRTTEEKKACYQCFTAPVLLEKREGLANKSKKVE